VTNEADTAVVAFATVPSTFAAATYDAVEAFATVPSTFVADTYEYDGSSWTTGGSGITNRADARGGGTQTDAIAAGGYNPSAISSAEGYDGTAWSTRPSISTARFGSAAGQGVAPASANWIAGGYTGSAGTNVHEEFTGETTTLNVKTLTQS